MLRNLLQGTATEDHQMAVQEGQLSREHSLKSKSPSPHPYPVTACGDYWWRHGGSCLCFAFGEREGSSPPFLTWFVVCLVSWRFLLYFCVFLRGLRLYLMRAYACLMVIEIICYEHSSMCCIHRILFL